MNSSRDITLTMLSVLMAQAYHTSLALEDHCTSLYIFCKSPSLPSTQYIHAHSHTGIIYSTVNPKRPAEAQ